MLTATTNERNETMTLLEKIQDLKNELEQSSSDQYKEAIKSQIRKLEKYLMTGSW